MTDLRYQSMLGAVLEASDIAKEEGVCVETAFAIQRERAALREQEYRDAVDAIESNVIYVDFTRRNPHYSPREFRWRNDELD